MILHAFVWASLTIALVILAFAIGNRHGHNSEAKMLSEKNDYLNELVEINEKTEKDFRAKVRSAAETLKAFEEQIRTIPQLIEEARKRTESGNPGKLIKTECFAVGLSNGFSDKDIATIWLPRLREEVRYLLANHSNVRLEIASTSIVIRNMQHFEDLVKTYSNSTISFNKNSNDRLRCFLSYNEGKAKPTTVEAEVNHLTTVLKDTAAKHRQQIQGLK